jgi:hypothetical protein
MSHRHLLLLMGLMLQALGLSGCAEPPHVVQGKVIAYEEKDKQLVVADEKASETQLELSLAGAEMSAPPAVGHLVRIAYHVRDGKSLATRVMNLSHQAEKKPAGGH